jgi:hypothetical protein
MNKLVKFSLISLSTLSLLFACQTPQLQTPEVLKAEALTSRAGFIKFFETCVLNKATLTESQKQVLRTQMSLINNVPETTWQSVSANYKPLFEQYSKYCDEKDTSSSSSPSSTPNSSSSPSPTISPSSTNLLTDDVFANKAIFKNFLDKCVFNSSEAPEALKNSSKILLSSLDAVPDERWQSVSGSYKVIYSQFIKSCNSSSPTTPTETLTAPTTFGELSCELEGKIKSGTGKSINVTFANNTGKSIKVYWLDFTGKRVPYNANLADKGNHPQQTYITHPWLIADSNDKCIKILTPYSSQTIDIK